jgi:putative ATP-dependent endonuclease of OLD family
MLFAKGVIFVEGDVEVLLVDIFAGILGVSLDQYGISVCNVYGTNFSHVVTLAHQFGIPFVVLTDGDKFTQNTGLHRGINLFDIINPDLRNSLNSLMAESKKDAVRNKLAKCGVFVNDWTLEVALLGTGLAEEMKQVFQDLGTEIDVEIRAGIQYIDDFLSDHSDDSVKKVLKAIDDTRWRKGRFAHRLGKYISDKADKLSTQESKNNLVPEYIRKGIEYLINQIRGKIVSEQGESSELISTVDA